MPLIPNTKPLDSGDVMPELRFALVAGGEQKIPQTTGDWSLFLIYRGEW